MPSLRQTARHAGNKNGSHELGVVANGVTGGMRCLYSV